MHRILQPALVAVAFISALVAWPRLPGRVPVHWNAAGEIDRYGGRFEGALLVPLMMLFLWGMLRLLPKIDPRRASYAKMAGTYELVITLTLAFTLVVHAALLGGALGYQVPIARVVPVAVGLLFMSMGNVLPRARPNWWFGVRTPWTLSNDRVWMRTHRVAGYTMFGAGILLALAGFVSAPRIIFTIVAVAVLVALVPVVYSYVAWRQETLTR